VGCSPGGPPRPAAGAGTDNRALELVEGTFCEVAHAADEGSATVERPFTVTVVPGDVVG
jgi:hypothetical protein